jgi:hypothetical protein
MARPVSDALFPLPERLAMSNAIPHKKQTKQKWLVGARVRVTKLMESCLKDVPKRRLSSLGRISGVSLRFPRTEHLRRVVYSVELDNELLGSHKWTVQPGFDTMQLQIVEDSET